MTLLLQEHKFTQILTTLDTNSLFLLVIVMLLLVIGMILLFAPSLVVMQLIRIGERLYHDTPYKDRMEASKQEILHTDPQSQYYSIVRFILIFIRLMGLVPLLMALVVIVLMLTT